jgi:hypothetical protein
VGTVPYHGAELDRRIRDAWVRPNALWDLPAPLPPPVGDNAGIPDRYILRNGLLVPRASVREPHPVALGARGHPRGIGYELDPLTRIRIALLGYPDRAAAAWSALHVWGLPYFCADADTCVLSGGRPVLASGPEEVTRLRRQGVQATVATFRPDPVVRDMAVVPPVQALMQALRMLWRGTHGWYTLPVAGTPCREVAAVQLLDSFCATFGVDPGEVPAAGRFLFDNPTLRRLVRSCDRGAESPMETVLRLLVVDLLGPTGRELVPQLVIHRDGGVSDPVHGVPRTGTTSPVVARVDLGHPGLKLALQYDGEGHLAKERRDRDARVNTGLANLGWHTLRLTHGHLTDPVELGRVLHDGVALCRARLGG